MSIILNGPLTFRAHRYSKMAAGSQHEQKWRYFIYYEYISVFEHHSRVWRKSTLLHFQWCHFMMIYLAWHMKPFYLWASFNITPMSRRTKHRAARPSMFDATLRPSWGHRHCSQWCFFIQVNNLILDIYSMRHEEACLNLYRRSGGSKWLPNKK